MKWVLYALGIKKDRRHRSVEVAEEHRTPWHLNTTSGQHRQIQDQTQRIQSAVAALGNAIEKQKREE